MYLEFMVHNYKPKDFIFIVDAEQFRFGHIFKLSLGILRDFLYFLQECLPLKMISMHVLNSSYIIDKMLIIAKPFLTTKFYNSVSNLRFSRVIFYIYFFLPRFLCIEVTQLLNNFSWVYPKNVYLKITGATWIPWRNTKKNAQRTLRNICANN